MSICKKVMEKHQGDICVDHSDAGGTRFRLRFLKGEGVCVEQNYSSDNSIVLEVI